VCYIVFIGAAASLAELRALLEEELSIGLDAARAPRAVVAAFPSTDEVCALLVGGCSCDLFEPTRAFAREPQVTHHKVWPTASFRRAVAKAVRRLGHVRLYIETTRRVAEDVDESKAARRGGLEGRSRPVKLCLADLVATSTPLCTSALTDVSGRCALSALN